MAMYNLPIFLIAHHARMRSPKPAVDRITFCISRAASLITELNLAYLLCDYAVTVKQTGVLILLIYALIAIRSACKLKPLRLLIFCTLHKNEFAFLTTLHTRRF